MTCVEYFSMIGTRTDKDELLVFSQQWSVMAHDLAIGNSYVHKATSPVQVQDDMMPRAYYVLWQGWKSTFCSKETTFL